MFVGEDIIEDPCLETEIEITADIKNPDCDSTNGSIKLNIVGGTAPFSYAWEPDFGNVDSISNLPEGIYSVTVLDSLNCFKNFSQNLILPDSCMDMDGIAPEDFEFGRINATVVNDQVQIEWEANHEQKNGQYVLESSRDRNSFRSLSLGKKAIGQSSNNYLLYDKTPTLGTSFYRIKYIDPQGDYTHSALMQVLVTPEGSPLFIAYPNPFSTNLTVDFLSPLTEDITIVIVDNLGKRIHTEKIQKGLIRKEFTLPEEAIGLFTLQVLSKNDRWVKRIMKIE